MEMAFIGISSVRGTSWTFLQLWHLILIRFSMGQVFKNGKPWQCPNTSGIPFGFSTNVSGGRGVRFFFPRVLAKDSRFGFQGIGKRFVKMQ
jgi:hypothetical protein